MKRAFLVFVALYFLSSGCFCDTIHEAEPNGCITLVGGNDPYQTLYTSAVIKGSVSPDDTNCCLYFEYDAGDEYIEDLYGVGVSYSAYYTFCLHHENDIDLDLFLMDEGLSLLNPAECGEYTCGVTCGEPELVNIYLDPGVYIVGVSSATVYNCFPPASIDYSLSMTETTQGERPVVTGLSKASSPFKLLVFGHDFEKGIRVFISGTEWTDFKRGGTELIRLRKGDYLKTMFPKNGAWVPITFINPTNRSTTILYNRLYNTWEEGGAERGD